MRSGSWFDTPVEFLKGVGPQRAEVLRKELGIYTFRDLISYYPFRYIDRSEFHTIASITDDMPWVQLRGRITSMQVHGSKRATRLSVFFTDGTGQVELVWFQGVRWISESLKTNVEYIVFGRPSLFNGRFNLAHPEIEEARIADTYTGPSLQGVYSSTEKAKQKGLDSKGLLRMMKTLVSQLPAFVPETLSPDLIHQGDLISLRETLAFIHLPSDMKQLTAAQYRIKFEELFYSQLRLLRAKASRIEMLRGKPVERIGEVFNSFYSNRLPFPLTNAQKRVLKEIRMDMGSGRQMNRLLQGDVGSGKTIVALLSMLMVIDAGMQACMMAPTEILAQQHYESIAALLDGTGLRVALLTGSTRQRHRRFIHESLGDGSLHILIGTQALIENKVQFANLGLVVIDEQHRFGVEQRARLWTKDARIVPHILVMTATPIPRTLAMTYYGDLDTSVIDELPPGRKPIRTLHYTDSKRLAVIGFMREQIKLARQVYIVYPLIEESEKMDYNNLQQGYETICREFPLPQYQVSMVHGRLKTADKDFEMQRFKNGQSHIMVATTVIEVGVNVPNASVMVIESAERFGLSQLHQLRGRVGRGADQSYCILMTGDKLGRDARLRMKTMCDTNDGFRIAEVDMELRGPGDIAGTQQSGVVSFKMADLARDKDVLEKARVLAEELLLKDPMLDADGHVLLKEQLQKIDEEQTNFSRIS